MNSRAPRIFLQITLAVMICAMSGCSESSDSEERVTQLQKELERTQTELQNTKQALGDAKAELVHQKISAQPRDQQPSTPSPASAAQTLPSREAFEQSYISSAQALKKQLQAELKNATLGSVTLHNVELPQTDYPVTSTVAISLASEGKTYRIEFPVKANAAGRWFFPKTSEIIQRMEEGRTIAADTSSAAAPTAGVAPTPASAPTVAARVMRPAGGGASGNTVVIQWPDSLPAGSSSSNNRPVPRPSAGLPSTANANPAASGAPLRPQPSAAASARPSNTSLPADRTVLVEF